MFRKSLVLYVFLSLGLLFSNGMNAQCSLCASNAASGVKSKTEKVGLGLNSGIAFLLVMPYAMVMTIGIIWYKNSRAGKRKKIIPPSLELRRAGSNQ